MAKQTALNLFLFSCLDLSPGLLLATHRLMDDQQRMLILDNANPHETRG